MREKITRQKAKIMFMESVYKSLCKQLADNGHTGRQDIFKLDNNKITVDLPNDFFNLYEAPENTKFTLTITANR